MGKGKREENIFNIQGFPNDPMELSKQDWADLYHTLKGWVEKIAIRHNSNDVQCDSTCPLFVTKHSCGDNCIYDPKKIDKCTHKYSWDYNEIVCLKCGYRPTSDNIGQPNEKT